MREQSEWNASKENEQVFFLHRLSYTLRPHFEFDLRYIRTQRAARICISTPVPSCCSAGPTCCCSAPLSSVYFPQVHDRSALAKQVEHAASWHLILLGVGRLLLGRLCAERQRVERREPTLDRRVEAP